jgi:capsular polysaccharide transport system permease protein
MSVSEVETSAREYSPTAEIAIEAPRRARAWLQRIGVGRPPAGLTPPLGVAASEAPRKRISGYLISFIVMVIAPAFAVSAYFAFIASSQYIAESRFAVHSLTVDTVTSSSKSSKPTTSSSFMGGLTASTDESYMVAAYIRSRACMEDVSRHLNLREMFRRPEADLWARLKANASPEELTKYWNYMVSAYVDPPSGIVTVSVAAFRREDSLAISEAILRSAEKVANEISAKARADVMKAAELEVTSAEDRVVSSLADLRAFREKAGFVDPKMQAESLGRLLEDLIGQRIRLQTEYEVSSKAMSPAAPTLQSIKGRIDQLDLQIAAEKAKLTSTSADPKALANLLPKYEELLVRNTFAGKLYALAADGLERARLRAEAQTIYIDVFVPPALPQDSEFPERTISSALIALALFIIWGIVALTAAIVEDHKL